VIRKTWLLLALVLALGCRPDAKTALQASSPDAGEPLYVHDDQPIATPPRLVRLPVVRQATEYSCGASVALSILRYYEHARYARASERSLYTPLHTTPADGTAPQPITDYLNHEPGLHAEARWSEDGSRVELEDLEHAVDRGEPTIVAIQAWQSVSQRKDLRPWATDWDDGHYVVVIGYDAQNLYFMDPSTEGHYTYIPRAEFLERWHDVLDGNTVRSQHIAIFVHAGASSGAGDAARATPSEAASPAAFVTHIW